jgi:hypothetical protein
MKYDIDLLMVSVFGPIFHVRIGTKNAFAGEFWEAKHYQQLT